MIVQTCMFAVFLFVLLEFTADQSDACAATVTTPGSCSDASNLLATADGTTFTLSSTGAQPVGTVITATCVPTTGDRWIRVLFDDGATGFEDEELTGGESLSLECLSSGKWQTTTTQEFPGGTTAESNVVTTGTVSETGSLLCEDFAG